MGVGDRVVAQIEKSIDAVALYLACLRGGFVYVPLNTAYTAEEVGYFIGDAEPAAFVYPPERTDKLRPVGELTDVGCLVSLGAEGEGTLAEAAASITEPDRSVVERGPDDLACMLYTSGTTGRSKGAMLTHANLASNGLALHTIWRWREGDVLLHCLPIFHSSRPVRGPALRHPERLRGDIPAPGSTWTTCVPTSQRPPS